MRLPVAAIFLCTLPLASLWAQDLNAVLGRMDRAARDFRSMTAAVRRVSHMAAINEDTVDTGTMMLKRAHPRDIRMLIDLTTPDPKTVLVEGRKAQIYYPKIQTVQEFDLGKNKALLDQFFLLGFGSTRAELESAYTMRALGPETINGQKTSRLELIPKSADVLQHLKKLEVWIGENGYPVQQKFFLPGGDYSLVTYSDVKINPELPDSAMKLHLPKGVKREYPQK